MRVAGIVVACVLLLGAIAAGAWWKRAQRDAHEAELGRSMWVDGFSAEYQLVDLKDPSKTHHGRILSNVLSEPRGMRYESVFPDRTRVTVWKQKDGAHWVLDPAAKTYWPSQARVKARLVAGSELDAIPGAPPGTTRERVGIEQVNGREAEHIRITEPREGGQRYSWDMWYDSRLHSMIKVVKPGESEYEWKNVRIGTQPAELFEVPRDYKKMEAPSKE